MQDVDSQRWLKLLRGDQVDEVPQVEDSLPPDRRRDDRGSTRKRRRLAGEDDTDRDMRVAKADADLASRATERLRSSDAPLTDSHGHINLFPSKSQPHEKNADAEAERAKKKREHEDQFTMRFSNAAGYKQGLNAPWYSTVSKDGPEEIRGKDVWGNEDIGRIEREKLRINASDPLAAMKKGVKQLREVEKGRQDWKAEREREMKELEDLERSQRSERKRRRRHQEDPDLDSLDEFRLDGPAMESKERRHRHPSHRRHKHSRSSRQDEADAVHRPSL
jgi:hypothetical protein